MTNWINSYIGENSNWRYIIAFLGFAVSFLLFTVLYNFISKRLQQRARNSSSPVDDFIVKLFRIPAKWIIFSVLLNIFSSVLKDDAHFFGIVQKISQILLILSIGWLSVQGIRAVFRYLQNKFDINNPNNLEARKRLTQLNMIEKVFIVTTVVIFVAVALMSIDAVRQLGVSLLASAGVMGVVIGLAAQRSVGQILSGVQIALTQPIRLDDVVVIEGEWGRIEEINITYAVVRIWDERRLIVPIDYFLNNPIQNWTRTTSSILGTVFLYVSYDLPLEPLREYQETIVKDDPSWDGRVQNIQVTDSREWGKEIRLLVSAADSPSAWKLRVTVREKMIDFINEHYPGSFARIGMKERDKKEV